MKSSGLHRFMGQIHMFVAQQMFTLDATHDRAQLKSDHLEADRIDYSSHNFENVGSTVNKVEIVFPKH